MSSSRSFVDLTGLGRFLDNIIVPRIVESAISGEVSNISETRRSPSVKAVYDYVEGRLSEIVDDIDTSMLSMVSKVEYDTSSRKITATNGNGTSDVVTVDRIRSDMDTFGASGSSAKKGLVPSPGTLEGSSRYLREDGTWSTPPDTTYSAGTGLSLDDGAFSLEGSIVSPGSAGPTSSVTGDDGTSISIPRIIVDTYGRVTGLSEYSLTNRNTTYSAATGSSNGLLSSADKTKLDGIAQGAEVNQNTFSTVKVGDVSVSADSKTDTLSLIAGNNISISADSSSDSLTLSAVDTRYSNGEGISLSGNTFSLQSGVVTAGSAGPTSNVSGTDGSTISVPRITVDTYGRVTGLSSYTLTNKDTTYGVATASSNGLLSSSDKNKLDGIAQGADSVSFDRSLSEGAEVGILTINGEPTTLYAPVNTDTKVTSVSNHYSPTSTDTKSASGASGTSGSTVQVITGIKMDAAGHVTDIVSGAATDTTYSAVTGSSNGLMISSDKTKLDGIEQGAEVNQNAFSNVVVGSTTISADSETDTITIDAGSNITLTPDASADKVTISAKDTTYSAGTGLSLSGTTINHSNSISAGTAGTSSATSGSSLEVPYVTYDAQGHVTGKGTHTHTVTGFLTEHQSLSAYAKLASPSFTGTPSAPTAAVGTNTTQIATTAFVKNEIDSVLQASDAMRYKGTLGTGGTITSLPSSHSQGDTYKVITAGTYAGKACEIGDMIICLSNGTSSSDDHWTVVQANIDGAVTGPVSATDSGIAVFNGTTGKVIKDSGFTIGKSVPSNAVFTDVSVDSASHHYKPSGGSTISASGASGTSGSTVQVVTGVTVDSAGHVTGVTSGAATDTTYSTATSSSAGLLSANDKKKLDGITESADSVSFSRSLTSGTRVGTLTINGTGTDLYAPTNTDTKVSSSVSSANGNYPLHINNGTGATTDGALINSSIYANPSTGRMAASSLLLGGHVTLSYSSDGTDNILTIGFV